MARIQALFYAKFFLAVLLGVAYSTETDQPEGSVSIPQTSENSTKKRETDSPEVILQLKYDRGELNRIYLTQFRKDITHVVPSVPTRTYLCADLCHAGLGGDACGPTCSDMIPVGLQTALESPQYNFSHLSQGEPRTGVCPTLCDNRLGEPLCNCDVKKEEIAYLPDWSGICDSFCTYNYTLSGCPTCAASHPEVQPVMMAARILSTSEGWQAWCGVQCVQGQGGAACNCDRSPI